MDLAFVMMYCGKALENAEQNNQSYITEEYVAQWIHAQSEVASFSYEEINLALASLCEAGFMVMYGGLSSDEGGHFKRVISPITKKEIAKIKDNFKLNYPSLVEGQKEISVNSNTN